MGFLSKLVLDNEVGMAKKAHLDKILTDIIHDGTSTWTVLVPMERGQGPHLLNGVGDEILVPWRPTNAEFPFICTIT